MSSYDLPHTMLQRLYHCIHGTTVHRHRLTRYSYTTPRESLLVRLRRDPQCALPSVKTAGLMIIAFALGCLMLRPRDPQAYQPPTDEATIVQWTDSTHSDPVPWKSPVEADADIAVRGLPFVNTGVTTDLNLLLEIQTDLGLSLHLVAEPGLH